MRLDDYDFKNISELYLEDLIYILHPSWALSQLEWDETLGSKYSTSAYCSFGCNGNLISHLKNGQCVFVKSFSTSQEIFGVLDHNGYLRWDLPLFLKARLESLIEGSIKRPATGGYYPNSELLEGNNQQSGLIVGGVQAGARTVVEKKYTEINSPTIEEMLANPELDGINSVALHPYEKIAEIAADGIEGIGEALSAAIDGDLQDAALIVLESALEIAGRKVKGIGKFGAGVESIAESGRVDILHPTEKAARRAAYRHAGMGKHGGRVQLPNQRLKKGSQSPIGEPGVRTEVRSTRTGKVVHYDPYGHKKDNVPPHYGVNISESKTTHHIYPSTHNPQNNR